MSKTILLEDDLVKSLHEKYMNGYTLRKLSLEVGYEYRILVRQFERLGLEVVKSKSYTKRSLVKDYFKCIDNQDKTYILGLLMSDGNVSGSTFKVKLHRDDRELLLSVSKILFGREMLYEYDSEPNVSVLQVSCQSMAEDLKGHGIVPRKTYKDISIPSSIPADLVRHFIRGFFDGDGSAGVYFLSGRVQRNFQFTCACKRFLEELRGNLNSVIGEEAGYIGEKPYNSSLIKGKEVISRVPCYVLCYRNREHLVSIYKYLYKSANLYLQRKKDKLYLAGLTPSELEELNYF